MTGLPVWDAIAPKSRARRVTFLGSSTTQGTVGISNGGLPEEFRQLAASRWGRGGEGFIGCWREQWGFTTGGNAWDTATGADAWDKGPSADARTGSGVNEVATYTGAAPGGFWVYICDRSGSAQFSYSIDGGSYVNISGFTFNANNALKRAFVATPATTSVRIRGANAAGTTAPVTLLGIEPMATTSGIIVDNAGRNSTSTVTLTRTSGTPLTDWLTLLNPDVVVAMYTNTLNFYEGNPSGWTTTWPAHLDIILAACTAAGAELVLGTYFSRGNFETDAPVEQDLLRTLNVAYGVAHSLPVVDLRNYYPTAAGAYGAGLLQEDAGSYVHPTEAGTEFMAQAFYRTIGRAGTEALVRV